MKDIELPPLPEPDHYAKVSTAGEFIEAGSSEEGNYAFYSSDDMHAYARAAVEADRAQRVPDDFLSHRSAWRAAMVIAEGFAANEDDASYWRHELKAFDNAYSMLASTPAPAQQVDDTLERKISRAATHAMTDFEVTNSIIYKCPALRLPQSFIQQLGMTAQIVVLKGATPEIAEFIAAACNEATESAAQHQEPPQQEVLCDCVTEIRADGEKETRCGSKQMWRAVQGGFAFASKPPQQERKPDPHLLKFYGVTTADELIAAQAAHIEKLQAKLSPLPVCAPQRVREG